MPSHISMSSYQMLNNREMFNSRDMCISPALLDFLEQTLEPFDNLIKAAAAQAAATTSNLTTPPTMISGGGQRKSDIGDGSNTDADATDLDETIHFSQDGFEQNEVSDLIYLKIYPFIKPSKIIGSYRKVDWTLNRMRQAASNSTNSNNQSNNKRRRLYNKSRSISLSM